MSEDKSFLKRDILLFNSQGDEKDELEDDDLDTLDTAASDREERQFKRYFNLNSKYIDQVKALSSTSVAINDINILFPFKPYNSQEILMKKVIESITMSQNALMESPTGTGKTLSMLCSALAWLNVKNSDKSKPKSKVYFVSRTHTQIKQIIRELKKTAYNPITVVLAGREQYCLKFDVSKESNASLRQKCNNSINSKSCDFYTKLNETKKTWLKETKSQVKDIEDSLLFGKACQICPFYMQKEMLKYADLILMPYSYIFTDKIRRELFNNFEDDVIIIDEAHHIDKACEEGLTVEMMIKDFNSYFNELKLIDLENSNVSDKNMEYIRNGLKSAQHNIFDYKKFFPKSQRPEEQSFDGAEVLKIFSEFFDIESGFAYALEILETAIPEIKTNRRYNGYLDNLRYILTLIDENLDNLECFSLIVSCESQKIQSIKILCLDPSISMSQLMNLKPRSVILTSGSLRPFRIISQELQMKFDVEHIADHVIDPKTQSYSIVIKSGSDGAKLKFNHMTRDDPNILRNLGLTLKKICQMVPNGVLVSFASYSLMNICLKFFQNEDKGKMWAEISRIKTAYIEPRDAVTVKKVIEDYKQAALKHGAILFGVCKGKVFEGIDFPDALGRAVVVVGIPYPNREEPCLKAKLNLLQKRRDKGIQNTLSPDEWLFKEATRSVCQAVGRVIRHANDYGLVFLCDMRFDEQRNKDALPSWVRSNFEVTEQLDKLGSKIKNFLDFNSKRVLVPTGGACDDSSKYQVVLNKKNKQRPEGEELDLNLESKKLKFNDKNADSQNQRNLKVPNFEFMQK